MKVDPGDAFHVGVVVANIDRAMEDLGSQLGLTWTAKQRRHLTLRHRGARVETDLEFAYSNQGPPHIELIGAAPGTPWEAADRMHHLGFWTADLERTVAEGTSSGLELDATYDDPSGRPVGFCYLQTPFGVRLEFVDESRRPGMEAWIAGGEFPAAPGN